MENKTISGDILSDLHLDFYFPNTEISDQQFNQWFDFISPHSHKHGEILFISGDIGHNNEQNVNVLKKLRKKYTIFFVLIELMN